MMNREQELKREFEIVAFDFFCRLFAKVLRWSDPLAGPAKGSELEVRICRITDWAVGLITSRGIGASQRRVLDVWKAQLQELSARLADGLKIHKGQNRLTPADFLECTTKDFFAFYESWQAADFPPRAEIATWEGPKTPGFHCPWCDYTGKSISSVTRHVGHMHDTSSRAEWKDRLRGEAQWILDTSRRDLSKKPRDRTPNPTPTTPTRTAD